MSKRTYSIACISGCRTVKMTDDHFPFVCDEYESLKRAHKICNYINASYNTPGCKYVVIDAANSEIVDEDDDEQT